MEGVGVGRKDLGELGAEVGDVCGVTFGGDDLAAVLLELLDGGAPDALGVVGLFGNGGKAAYAVGPESVAGVDADLDVADLGAEDVVAGVGDVGVAGEAGEEDHAVGLGEGCDAEHCAAAGGAEDDLDAVDVGELVIGGDGVRSVALGVLDDEFEHAAVDAAGGVDLVEGHLLGLPGYGPIGLAGAGEGLHDADAEGVGFGGAGGYKEGQEGEDEEGEGFGWVDQCLWGEECLWV